MRILFLAPFLPYPPTDGGRQRMFQMLKHLSARHIVDLVALDGGGESPFLRGLEKLCRRIFLIPRPLHRGGWTHCARRARNHLFFIPFDRDPAVDVHMEQIMHNESYDGVQVEKFYMTPYAVAHAHVPAILDGWGLDSIEAYREFQHTERGGAKIKAFVRWMKLRRFERRLGENFSTVIVVSKEEKEALSARGVGSQIVVVPNGVDCDYFRPGEDRSEDERSLIFTGHMGCSPNVHAVTFFYRKIFPLIRKVIANCTIWIVGKDPPSLLLNLARDPCVKVTGCVSDVRPYVARSAVFINPMRMGGGTRTKVLEALAMRKAVVSTPVGVEGIRVTPGREVLLADDPETFAEAVIRLLKDRDLRLALGMRGRQCVEEHYQWKRCLSPLEEIYH